MLTWLRASWRIGSADAAQCCAQVLGMKMKAYLPDFTRAFEHFCIHTGGRGVIDEMEKQLRCSRDHMRPPRRAAPLRQHLLRVHLVRPVAPLAPSAMGLFCILATRGNKYSTAVLQRCTRCRVGAWRLLQ